MHELLIHREFMGFSISCSDALDQPEQVSAVNTLITQINLSLKVQLQANKDIYLQLKYEKVIQTGKQIESEKTVKLFL